MKQHVASDADDQLQVEGVHHGWAVSRFAWGNRNPSASDDDRRRGVRFEIELPDSEPARFIFGRLDERGADSLSPSIARDEQPSYPGIEL